jgi:hypothetical protein
MDSTGREPEPLVYAHRGLAILLLLSTIPIFATWWWTDYRWRVERGEPPLVPYRIPWLGHGLSFMKDVNAFTAWAR